MFGAILWTPSIVRDFFIITITLFFVENFKKLNEKLTNIEKKVSNNI